MAAIRELAPPLVFVGDHPDLTDETTARYFQERKQETAVFNALEFGDEKNPVFTVLISPLPGHMFPDSGHSWQTDRKNAQDIARVRELILGIHHPKPPLKDEA